MVDGDQIQEIIAAFQDRTARTGIHPSFSIKKRRTASERLKARMRYKRNKNKLKVWRKRYNQKRKMFHAARKLLKRPRPSWLSHSGTSSPSHQLKSFVHRIKHNPIHHFSVNRPKGIKHAPHAFKIHKPKKVTHAL